MLPSPRYTPEQWESIQRQAQLRKDRAAKRAARDARLSVLANRVSWAALYVFTAGCIAVGFARVTGGPNFEGFALLFPVGILFGATWAAGIFAFFRSATRRNAVANVLRGIILFPFRLVGWIFLGLWRGLLSFGRTSKVDPRPLVGAAGLRSLRNVAYVLLLAHWLFGLELPIGSHGALIVLGLAFLFGFSANQIDALNLWLQARERWNPPGRLGNETTPLTNVPLSAPPLSTRQSNGRFAERQRELLALMVRHGFPVSDKDSPGTMTLEGLERVGGVTGLPLSWWHEYIIKVLQSDPSVPTDEAKAAERLVVECFQLKPRRDN